MAEYSSFLLSASLNNPMETNESQICSIMNVINQPAFIHALSADWKVGYQLWKFLTQELQKQVTDIRRQHLPMDLGGNQPNQGGKP